MALSRRQLSKFTAILAGGTLLSRMLGLVRDMVWAAVPAGPREAFLVAFKLPNMLRDIVGEGALNAAFVPVFSDTRETGSEADFKALVASAMGAMLLLLAVLTVLGVVLAPMLLQGLNALQPVTGGPERSPDELALLVTLARWTFPYLFFIGLAVFGMGALFTVRHYATPSWSPALLNVAFIASCLLLMDWFPNPAYALVFGVWLGGLAQLAAMYIATGRHVGVWLPRFRFRHPGVLAILALMGPVVLGQAAGEVNKLVDTLFAYSLGEGVVTALYYANRLVQLPLSVFGFATAAAVLPAASAAVARGDMDELRDTVSHGLTQTFFLVAPAMTGLIVLGEPIIRLLFERWRSFGPENTHQTAVALAIYAMGLISFAWVKVTVTGFFAQKNTKTPVIVGSISMGMNIALNLLLVGPLGYKGLALATTVSYTFNFVVLYVLLSRQLGQLATLGFLVSVMRIAVSTAIMAALTYGAYRGTNILLPDRTFLADMACVAVPIVAAVVSYGAVCRLLRVAELGHFMSLLRRKRGQ
ncbi:MAG: murein biosynthesis integral membrane protein MurJ [bacterium]|nr:murein biosynthesis integral membrane protein MurJ [bacterium]